MATEPTQINIGIVNENLNTGTSAYYIWTSTGQTEFNLPSGDTMILGTSFVYANNVYQSFLSYSELSNGNGINFNSPIGNGVPVEIRYLTTSTPLLTTTEEDIMNTYTWTSTGGNSYKLPAGFFYAAGSTMLYINQFYQFLNSDYFENADGQTITTSTNIPTGYQLQIRYVAL